VTVVAVVALVGLALSLGWQAYTFVRSLRRSADESIEHETAQLISGVGQVCIVASMLEWALTYLTGLIDNWDDEKHRKVFSSPGQPLKEYRNLVPRLFLPLREDAAQLADDAGRLLAERHRVVHSVMMIETKAANEQLYEAWHARTDTTWQVVPEDLTTLAIDLGQCVMEATAFAHAWQERAERDGWPILPGNWA
jgi:hypothetical protein